MERQRPILTIGHSKMAAEEFVALCRKHFIREVVDIRSHPTSRWEWFRQEQMSEWLASNGLDYIWEPGLGGWTEKHCAVDELRSSMKAVGVNLSAYARGFFPKERIAADRVKPDEGSPEWTNQGLYDYAWYMAQDEFQQAADRLVQKVEDRVLQRPALMCCEALWWKCHRSMVADYLTHVHNRNVFHVQPRLTLHLDAIGNRIDRYPTRVRRTWYL